MKKEKIIKAADILPKPKQELVDGFYVFKNPGKAFIRTRTGEQSKVCDTQGDIWRFEDGGEPATINWPKLNFTEALQEALKAFVFYRLESKSPQTVKNRDRTGLRKLSREKEGKVFPWDETMAIRYFSKVALECSDTFSFLKSFYRWAVKRGIRGFERPILAAIEEIKPISRKPYEKVYLNQIYITAGEEALIVQLINQGDASSYNSFRDNILLHLAFELAPRPIQIHTVDESDLEVIKVDTPDAPVYYTLWLPMAKKLSSGTTEKRPRSISKALGGKLEALIQMNHKRFGHMSEGLFRKERKGGRMPSLEISKTITKALQSIGFKKGTGATALRHLLGQSLADQGSSAEVIAEMLGHNSTLPARAYISATPQIATIKTRALGKNKTYESIMHMLMTGEIIDREQAEKDRWVKGLVGMQYIGGIGACGLSADTPCPKNPVYSCYTCKKFHPFADGTHEEVKKGLQNQVQEFLDVATDSMDLQNNRALLQLEKTIEAVDAVIEKCRNR